METPRNGPMRRTSEPPRAEAQSRSKKLEPTEPEMPAVVIADLLEREGNRNKTPRASDQKAVTAG